MRALKKFGYGVALLSIFLPMVVLFSIWIPLIDYYYVATDDIDQKSVEAMRIDPGDQVFDEVNRYSLGSEASYTESNTIKVANNIINGKLELPRYPAISIDPEFNEEDLKKGGPTFQLVMSSLKIPEILLEAYLISNEEKYFKTSENYIFQWIKYEENTLIDPGYLWNDHAIAARVYVLGKFWSIYRSHANFTYSRAKRLVQEVERSAKLLSKPSHFTFSTNHGVMQNIALLHLAIIFPRIKDRDLYIDIALNRLKDQLKFYINDEGVVLEHSAGYHSFGVELLGMTLRYLTILERDIPEDWRSKYNEAVDFLENLVRPDKTMPMYGNTDYMSYNKIKIVNERKGKYGPIRSIQSKPNMQNLLKPAAGYSIWWDGLEHWGDFSNIRQTISVWSYYKGHGHKHADEMSVLLWAGGQAWWSNVGYWPYGKKYIDKAWSWGGSNAPHIIGENISSERQTNLLSYVSSDDISFIDLKRINKSGYNARRQLLHFDQDLWLVLDFVNSPSKSDSEIIWTTFPKVGISNPSRNSIYKLLSNKSHQYLEVAFLASGGVTKEIIKGEINPFAGWIAKGGKILETYALRLVLPSDAWVATVWNMSSGTESDLLSPPKMLSQSVSPENWKIQITKKNSTYEVARDGDRLTLIKPGESGPHQVALVSDFPGVESKVTSVNAAFEIAKNKYKKFRELYPYRVKMSFLVIIVVFLQELLLFFIRAYKKEIVVYFRTLAILFWTSIYYSLYFIYFQ